MDIPRLLFKVNNALTYFNTSITELWNGPPENIVTCGSMRLHVRRRTSDMLVIDEVFRRNMYEEPPHGVVIDVGANIGAFSLFAAQTASHVFAFEPESSNYEQLEKNISLNSVSNVTLFKKAIGGSNRTTPLYRASSNKGTASTAVDHSSDTEDVEMVTLKTAIELCHVSRVDTLKVDIEGGEYELFENAPLEVLQRITTILMETHPVRGKHFKNIVNKLRSAGFNVRVRYTRLSLGGIRMVYASRSPHA